MHLTDLRQLSPEKMHSFLETLPQQPLMAGSDVAVYAAGKEFGQVSPP